MGMTLEGLILSPLDSHFHGNDIRRGMTLVSWYYSQLDSHFHGNDIGGFDSLSFRFPFARE